MKLKTFLSVIFILLFLPGQGFAEGSKFDRFATDAEVTAQTRDDVGLSPSSIPHIMSAPGTVSKFQLDHNVELLNADRTVLITDKPIQRYDCNGSDRNVTLSAEASSTDLVFTFYNDSDGANEDLVVRDDTPTTLITIGPEQGARVSCDGTSWKVLDNKGIYYDGISDKVEVQTDDNAFGIGSGSNVDVYMNIAGTRTMIGYAGNDIVIQGGASKGIVFIVNSSTFGIGTSAIKVLINGNVGIGTTSPDTLLELQKESADAEETISVYHDTEATASIITMRKADNNATAPALVDDNAVLGRINFKGHDGTGWHTGAKIEARVDGTPSDGDDMPTELVFSTTADGAGSPTERMILMPSGQLKMAESSAPGALADHVYFYGANVSGTTEAFAADAAANAAQLTPHNFDLFEPDSLEAYPWSYYAENRALGIKINVDMAGAIRAIEGLTGKTFIYTESMTKNIDLEKVYKDKWIEDYIKAGIQKTGITKVQALETVKVDIDKWYEIEIVDPKTGKITITEERKKIGETITGYELVDGEVKPKIETLYETEKIDKIQIKAGMSFDEADGKFYLTTKPTKAQAITAAAIGFKFKPPKWLDDRLKK